MKPLNLKERRIAFMKFFGVFLLALALVISSAFVAGVKIPPATHSNQGQVCQERELLALYIDTLEQHVSLLRDMDKHLADQTNKIEKGEQENKIQEEENRLRDFLGKTKNLKTELPEKNAVCRIGDAYLLLRTLSQKPEPKDPDGGGWDKEDCEPWKARLQDANERIGDLKAIAASASTALGNLKVKVLNLKREETKNKIEDITGQLNKAGQIQKVPAY